MIHYCLDDLGSVFSLDCPCQSRPPGREDFRKRNSERDYKRTLEKAAAGSSLDDEGGLFTEDGLEVWACAPKLIKGQRDKPLGCR